MSGGRVDHGARLLRVFGNADQDLAANRQGRLGAAQGRRLLASGSWNVAGALLIGLLLVAILAYVADKPLVPIQWILSLVLFAVAQIAGIRHFRKTRAAVADGRVERLAGEVQIGCTRYAGWQLHVAGRSFRLPIRPWHVQRGAAYRVYVEPRTQVLVAMEPLTVGSSETGGTPGTEPG